MVQGLMQGKLCGRGEIGDEDAALVDPQQIRELRGTHN